MKPVEIHQNFLDPALIKEIKEYSDKQVGEFTWRSSYAWPQLVQRFTPPVLALELTPFHKSIQDQYRKLSKSWKNIEIHTPLFYAWPQGSYIAWHSDQEYEFASIIYLNQQWDMDYGGIFLYYENKKIRGLSPHYNQCVLSAQGVPHAVSRTTIDAPVRQTIQIFGKKKKTTSFYADGGRKKIK